MSQLFNKIKVGTSARSTFDLSHHQVTTSDFGYLIPICYRDMVPNDDFVVKPNVFCRLAPLAVPTYGRITCRVHHFFVPYRLLYPHWNAFIGGSKSNFTVPPFFTASVLQQALNTDPQYNPSVVSSLRGRYCRLMSNLGLNPDSVKRLPGSEHISAFPFLAYYRIWLDYFADTNLVDHPSLVAQFNQLIADGGAMIASATNFLETKNVCFKKDYFTTAKLDPQDGNASEVSLGFSEGFKRDFASDFADDDQGNLEYSVVDDGTKRFYFNTLESGPVEKPFGFTVEALRAATSAQRYSERSNYVGSKIINKILAHFGIAPTPERLDMAEFIDGDSFPIQIGDVTSQNSLADANDNYSTFGLGMQAGKGVGAGSGVARYHAKEHGIFMSLMSILPDTGYYQGISRHWSKGSDPLDYYTPEFENLGYQEVLNKELYVGNSDDGYSNFDPDGVFGYVPRYSEYKFQNDVLAGDFVGNTAGNGDLNAGAYMDSWHLFRKLRYTNDNPLALNENFVECNNRASDYDRVFQLTDNTFDHFYFNIDVDVKATRPMVGFAEPSLDSVRSEDGNAINLPYGGTRL